MDAVIGYLHPDCSDTSIQKQVILHSTRHKESSVMIVNWLLIDWYSHGIEKYHKHLLKDFLYSILHEVDLFHTSTCTWLWRGTVWRLVLFIIAGDCERRRRGCLRLRAESAARLRSWLCLIVWAWLVNGAASRVRLRPLCTFQDSLVIFLLGLQPLHCVISWWVQSGSLHLQENHQVLDCEGFRPKPGVTSFKKNPLIAKSWGLNWKVILMKCLTLNKPGPVYNHNSSDKKCPYLIKFWQIPFQE